QSASCRPFRRRGCYRTPWAGQHGATLRRVLRRYPASPSVLEKILKYKAEWRFSVQSYALLPLEIWRHIIRNDGVACSSHASGTSLRSRSGRRLSRRSPKGEGGLVAASYCSASQSVLPRHPFRHPNDHAVAGQAAGQEFVGGAPEVEAEAAEIEIAEAADQHLRVRVEVLCPLHEGEVVAPGVVVNLLDLYGC